MNTNSGVAQVTCRRLFKIGYPVILLFLFAHSHLNAAIYGTICGRIYDADNQQPLPFTNVFLANTTCGDAADEQGAFCIERITPGIYQLVVSRIGYELFVQEVVISSENRYNIPIKLRVSAIQGSEIVIESQPDREWKKLLKEFTRIFIGTSLNAKACVILNPEVLTIIRDKQTNEIIAHTDSLLRVENRALGYNLTIVLQYFRWSDTKGKYVIYPQFSEIAGDDRREHVRWRQMREQTFEQSIRYFFAMLTKDNRQDDFILHRIPDQSNLSGKNIRETYLPFDQLKVSRLDSIPQMYQLEFNGILQVYNPFTTAASTLKLIYQYVKFDEYGNTYPAEALQIGGLWGEQRVADMLPFDYRPEKVNDRQ